VILCSFKKVLKNRVPAGVFHGVLDRSLLHPRLTKPLLVKDDDSQKNGFRGFDLRDRVGYVSSLLVTPVPWRRRMEKTGVSYEY
jgi:hypothetical protein